jgi:hypothetical protein
MRLMTGVLCATRKSCHLLGLSPARAEGDVMAEMQMRGYIIVHTVQYLRDKLGDAEWNRVSSTLSPELRAVLSGEVKHGGWYPISYTTELNRVLLDKTVKGGDDAAREALHSCGRYIAGAATNTFLKMLMKMLTPNLFARKLPDVFRRDFSSGRLESSLDGRKLTCRYFDVPGFEHSAVLASGFAAKAFEGMGKEVETFSVHKWSLAEPNLDGSWFELTWKD